MGLHRLESFRVGVSVLFFALIAFLFLDFRNIVAPSVAGGLLYLQFVTSLLRFANAATRGAAACTVTPSVPWARCWAFSRRCHFFKSPLIQVSARDLNCAKACARRAASIAGRRRWISVAALAATIASGFVREQECDSKAGGEDLSPRRSRIASGGISFSTREFISWDSPA
jgi:hypothetical protein